MMLTDSGPLIEFLGANWAKLVNFFYNALFPNIINSWLNLKISKLYKNKNKIPFKELIVWSFKYQK